MKEELNPSKVFSSIAVFEMLREQLRMAATTTALLISGKVSLDRIDDFLHNVGLSLAGSCLPSANRRLLDRAFGSVLGVAISSGFRRACEQPGDWVLQCSFFVVKQP
jgi:hypothetical protein